MPRRPHDEAPAKLKRDDPTSGTAESVLIGDLPGRSARSTVTYDLTARRWLSVLQASYVVTLLAPPHQDAQTVLPRHGAGLQPARHHRGGTVAHASPARRHLREPRDQ